tara:strand:+ start:692 stop:1018 length:327 start_codon:yes stop_codon:yes gene_type:complete
MKKKTKKGKKKLKLIQHVSTMYNRDKVKEGNNMSTMIWNGKQQEIKGTIVEDIINGFWKVSEDVYYDSLAVFQEDIKYVDPTPDDTNWFSDSNNDKGSDSDQIHYRMH